MIVETAREWIGTRWLHQGRSKEGVDCVGLIICVGQELCMPIVDFKHYSRRPTAINFMDKFEESGGIRIAHNQARDGDVAVYAQYGYPCHCGIISDKGVIHAFMPHKRVVEEKFTSSPIAFFRYPDG